MIVDGAHCPDIGLIASITLDSTVDVPDSAGEETIDRSDSIFAVLSHWLPHFDGLASDAYVDAE